MQNFSWKKLLCKEKKVLKSREERTKNDERSIFERDYHRIVSSSSFRRLQDKAQVFPLEKYDFVRTRLTHSIEVASVARSLGKGLVSFIQEKEPDCEEIQFIPNILECAGLLHDIGNPPFGHFGENAIRDWFAKNLDNIVYNDGEVNEGNRWFYCHSRNSKDCETNPYKKLSGVLTNQQKNDLLNFEGNAQTLRNAMKLNYIIDENGLNLTYPLLNTIIKYTSNSEEINEKSVSRKKLGYFYSEQNEFNEITIATGVNLSKKGVFRHPLTYLLEAADDITFLTDDLEDAFNKQKIEVNDIKNLICSSGFIDDFCSKLMNKINEYASEAERQCYKNTDMYVVQRLKIYLQGNLISSVTDSFINNYESIMDGSFTKTLLGECSGNNIASLLGELEKKYIYPAKDILENEVKGHKIIEGILNELVIEILNLDDFEKSKSYRQKLYQLISDNYRLVYEKRIHDMRDYLPPKDSKILNPDKIYYKLLLLTDFVCGMTDSYAYTFYQRIQSIN